MHTRRAPRAKRVEFARKFYKIARGDIADIVGSLTAFLTIADIDCTHTERRTFNQRST
jgi:hypothetical protein